MKRISFVLLTILACCLVACKSEKKARNMSEETRLKIETTVGDIVVKLYKETPKHRDIFIKLAEDGTYEGTGKGIGGDVPVTVTVEGGKIAAVEVGDNSETQGIGSNAIEQLPEQFVGLKTAEEVDALDGVSGATITSKDRSEGKD